MEQQKKGQPLKRQVERQTATPRKNDRPAAERRTADTGTSIEEQEEDSWQPESGAVPRENPLDEDKKGLPDRSPRQERL